MLCPKHEITDRLLIFNELDRNFNAQEFDGEMLGVKRTEIASKSAGTVPRLDYKAAPYHGKVDNSVKSRAPINGQEALETSIQIKPTSPRRVGVDYKSNDFIVFDKTFGYDLPWLCTSWTDLHPDMQQALQQAGMVDRKGNILVDGKR